MPTRAETLRFRRIYDGFAYEGLRTEIDPAGSTPLTGAGRFVRLDLLVFDERDRRVGELTRLLVTDGSALRARHERFELAPAARGRGFARALQLHAEPAYRSLGVAFVTMHAEYVGALLWPRLGFDFDLRNQPGETERERRGHAVLDLLSPAARPVEGQPRPAERLAADPELAARLAPRLPTPERIAAGELGGLLLDARSLGDAAPELMLGASFDAYRWLGGRRPG